MRKKIAVVITHRAPYGRLKPVLKAIQKDPRLELQIIVGTSALTRRFLFALRHLDIRSLKKSLPWYIRSWFRSFWTGNRQKHDLLAKTILDDGFYIDAYFPIFLDSGNLISMTQSAGNILFDLSEILQKLKPDILLVHADRFEMLAVAMTGNFLNIPIAHTQGGDVSGTVDEMVRHSITKLAHIHFPTTEKSMGRILQMGEDPNCIFMTGCPTIDTVRDIDLTIDKDIYLRNGRGFGDKINLNKPFLLVLHHPVTTEYERSKKNMQVLIDAIKEINMPTFFFWPNIDGGSDGASEAIREFVKSHNLPALSLYKTFKPDDFYRILNAASVAIGNSSSFIREGSYLGVPAVIVGTRQYNRERDMNVIEVENRYEDIVSAIKTQLSHGKYPSGSIYGSGGSSKKIADILATKEIKSVQKYFRDLK
ncbi:MAG: UDP-N-acetylglucosamine 2-epimerase (hydrolyzing) [Candidatus Magasanikbacteria bacterium]|nr:UDP-N-acetylglucosamine 2-epimerase (hydrolyzing) [Candidatus Magasanikbacteria bacterium]